jgi:hypothetical protein
MPDQPLDPAAELEADLRELRRLAGARLAADDDDLMRPDGTRDLAALRGDGKGGIEIGLREPGAARGMEGRGNQDATAAIPFAASGRRHGGAPRAPTVIPPTFRATPVMKSRPSAGSRAINGTTSRHEPRRAVTLTAFPQAMMMS